MFTNKHVIIAMLVAPLLALLGWYAVGNWLGEKPAPARPGQAYPLVAKSNCRYPSGECELENNDLSLRITAGSAAAYSLELSASHPLESVLMSVADPAADPGPRIMQPLDDTGLRWRYAMLTAPRETDRLRVVVASAGSAYFAEASTAFLQASEAAWTSQ